MNKIILLIILFSSEGYTQNKLLDILPLKDAKVNYSNVLELEGTSKDELYKRAKYWLLNSSDYFYEIVDTDNKFKQINSKGSFKEIWGPNDYAELYVNVIQTVSLFFRDGRYKYEITNFIIKKPGMESQIEIYQMENKKLMKYNKLFYEKIDLQIKNLIISLEESMLNNIPIEK